MLHTPAQMNEDTRLLPITELLPSQRPRWIFTRCRAGDIKGAVKVGRQWLISARAFKEWASSQGVASSTPTALEELRAAGFGLR